MQVSQERSETELREYFDKLRCRGIAWADLVDRMLMRYGSQEAYVRLTEEIRRLKAARRQIDVNTANARQLPLQPVFGSDTDQQESSAAVANAVVTTQDEPAQTHAVGQSYQSAQAVRRQPQSAARQSLPSSSAARYWQVTARQRISRIAKGRKRAHAAKFDLRSFHGRNHI